MIKLAKYSLLVEHWNRAAVVQ